LTDFYKWDHAAYGKSFSNEEGILKDWKEF
jgi:hypothetical protein